MSDTREKIAKSMWEYDNPQDKNAIKIKFEDYPKSLDFIQEYYTKADAILSLVREAVSAVKPKERITPHEERFDDEIRCGNVGYNQGVSDYHDALIKTFT